MYKKNKVNGTSLKVNQSTEGETIEQKVERIVNNNEPITDGAPIMYTERKEGVPAGHDIRTDRWDVAIDAMDKVSKTFIAKREANIIEMNKKSSGENGGAESTQGN